MSDSGQRLVRILVVVVCTLVGLLLGLIVGDALDGSPKWEITCDRTTAIYGSVDSGELAVVPDSTHCRGR